MVLFLCLSASPREAKCCAGIKKKTQNRLFCVYTKTAESRYLFDFQRFMELLRRGRDMNYL